MDNRASHAAPGTGPSVTGWAISGVFHVSALLLLALAINEVPRHGLNFSGRSPGIVLQLDSAAGDDYDGEVGPGESADVVELVSPDQSMSAQLEEPAPPDIEMETTPTPAAEPVAAATSQAIAPPPTPPAPAAISAAGPPRTTSIFATREGQAGSPAGRGYAHVRVFGVEGQGNKFVYVFDRSASMEGPPLAAAKRQLVQSLGSLAGIHQFQIIFFNHRLQSFDSTGGGRRIAFGSDRNKQLAANFVGGITAEGGTDRYAALKAALAFRPDVIFFLSDADDPMSASELQDIQLGSDRNGSSICVIEFGRQPAPAGDNFLQALARQTGGQYGYVNTARLTAAVR